MVNLPDGLPLPGRRPGSGMSSGSGAGKTAPRPSGNRAPSRSGPPSGPPMAGPGPVQTISPPPRPPSVNAYLSGDDVYQQSVRGSKRSTRDFLSDLTRRRGEAKTSFGQTKEQLERDRGLQLDRLKDEFASRGILQSSLFADEQGRFQQDFATQLEMLTQANQQLVADLLSQETNFRREMELAMEASKQEALSRRAAQFGIS